VNALTDLTLEHYLDDLSPDAPCGENLEYDPDFAQLERDAEGTPERQLGDSIIPGEEPDWKKVKEQALTLLERSKDIQVSVYLTRALVYTEGFAGLAKGLALINGLLRKYWDELYPRQDDDDDYPVLRMNTLTTLNDYTSVLGPLSHIPLVSSPQLGDFSWLDIEIAAGNIEALNTDSELPDTSVVEAAFLDADIKRLQSQSKMVSQALEQAQGIVAITTEKVGSVNAPDLSNLTTLLKKIQRLLRDKIQQKGDVEASVDETEAETNTNTTSTATRAPVMKGDGIHSREDVGRAIDAICQYFQHHEPSSPIPLLLIRAKKLLPMNFMEILQDLTPDAVAQAENICGIKKQEQNK
jgi:type VI secretion system protein ImpA